MGIPELSVIFKDIIKKPMSQISIGKILILVKEDTVTGKHEYSYKEDIKEQLYSDTNKKYIEDCFIGNEQDVRINTDVLEVRTFTPDKVIVQCVGTADTLDTVLATLETEKFDFLVMPDATEEDNAKLVAFIKKVKEQNLEAFAVIASKTNTYKSEDVIVLNVDDFVDGGVSYTCANLLPYITSILAGTPIEQSVTYAVLKDINAIPTKAKSEIDTVIDGGSLTLINKGGQVRIARGVTSLTDVTADKGETFKKIKEVRIYKYINNFISDIITNHYVGKVANSYKNKIVLLSEIKGFLKSLSGQEIIGLNYNADINLLAQKEYLKSKGIDVKSMEEKDIREANTDNKVFLKLTLSAIDSMEDFKIEVEV